MQQPCMSCVHNTQRPSEQNPGSAAVRRCLKTDIARVCTFPDSRSGDGPAAGDASSKAGKGSKSGGSKKKKTAENGEKKKSKVSKAGVGCIPMRRTSVLLCVFSVAAAVFALGCHLFCCFSRIERNWLSVRRRCRLWTIFIHRRSTDCCCGRECLEKVGKAAVVSRDG